MGFILLGARIFDAFNDPVMGIIVAKTRTRWGKFRPWLLIGTLLNAVVLYLMFAAPPTLDGSGMVAYAAVTYIVWGVTYTMMDIPYWSMIPAFTEGGKEREGLSAMARSCAGVGSAIVTIITMKCVYMLGQGDERTGFRWFALIIAVIFVLCTLTTCINIKEKSTVQVDAPSIKQMLQALIQNDQAMATVITIVLINMSMYITSNLVIYFFKYDFGGDVDCVDGIELNVFSCDGALHFGGEHSVHFFGLPDAVQKEGAAVFKVADHVVLRDVGRIVASHEIRRVDKIGRFDGSVFVFELRHS